MYNLVKIGDKAVPMLCMASTDLYYKNIFHADPLPEIEKAGETDAIGIFQRMAFVMAKFAELHDRKKMLMLSEDDFLAWLDNFERGELMEALGDVQKTYLGQTITEATAKKNNDEPSET